MYQVLLFSPEMTATDEYDAFIHDEVARPRIGYFVDEIHLMYEWGPEFRTVYETLYHASPTTRVDRIRWPYGYVRARRTNRHHYQVGWLQGQFSFRKTCKSLKL